MSHGIKGEIMHKSVAVRSAQSPSVLRPLGAVEQLMWLLDQNRPTHFALAALVEGPTTIKAWRKAIDLVQRRHPLFSVCIEGAKNSAPLFRQVTGASIPLRVVHGSNARLLWESEIEQELSTPFDAREAPLVRAVLLHEEHRTIYVLVAHHSIADGLSIAFCDPRHIGSALGKTG
jgi:Condensation domain